MVMMKPPGSLPGMISFAIAPIIRPMINTQIKCILSSQGVRPLSVCSQLDSQCTECDTKKSRHIVRMPMLAAQCYTSFSFAAYFRVAGSGELKFRISRTHHAPDTRPYTGRLH